MKGFLLVLLGGLLFNAHVLAQVGSTTQRGKATQEMDSAGFNAAHGNFPLGSTVKVVNTATEKEINVTVTSRIQSSPERIVDLSLDAWNALELTGDTVVMLVYSPPAAARPNSAVAEPHIAPEPAVEHVEIIREKEYPNEIARLKPTQTLYHLLLLDRRNCIANSDIGDLQNIKLIYKFLHDKNGYLVAVYSSSVEGPIFPVMPDKSRVLVDMMTTDKAFIKDYVGTAAFRRFVTNRQVVSRMQRELQ
ncbi:MAG: septal ring lytic transglycosylase RlpA family protein [Treponema sp.]|jgi:hypothetical protein|nr:septal ring lytic transglycosylase RlpA family protein [Treponema sp.]